MSDTPRTDKIDARLFDLVRFMRSELHQADLITDEEYSWLCHEADLARGGGSPSPRRLEGYDDVRQKLAELERENNQLRTQLAERDKLLDRLAEWCMDLKGEWDWKKDEPRAGNKAEYDQLCADIDTAIRLTRRGSVT